MRRLNIAILAIVIALSLSSVSWTFQGKSSGDPASKIPGTIFGIVPWESRDGVIAKNALAGIDSIEISEEKAVFKDLIDREFSTPPPREVHYFFVNGVLYRIQLLYVGTSAPYKKYSSYFFKLHGQPVFTESGEYEEATWKTDQYILKLRSNHEAETTRQLKNMVREPGKILVTTDVIFTATLD